MNFRKLGLVFLVALLTVFLMAPVAEAQKKGPKKSKPPKKDSPMSAKDEDKDTFQVGADLGANVFGFIPYASMTTKEKASTLTAEVLAKRWHIGIEAAKRTLRQTTQNGVRDVLVPSERKIRKKTNFLRFPTLRGRFYTDTMFSKDASTRGHKTAQVFTNGLGYDFFYPMKTKANAPDALMAFIHDAGIPQTNVSDNAPEEYHGNWGKTSL